MELKVREKKVELKISKLMKCPGSDQEEVSMCNLLGEDEEFEENSIEIFDVNHKSRLPEPSGLSQLKFRT